MKKMNQYSTKSHPFTHKKPMKSVKSVFIFLTIVSFSLSVYGQKLPVYWEELTASDFVEAVKKSEGVCLVPMGVIEKHGQHLPLGSDVYYAREICRRVAEKEYCIVFPYFFAGQNFVSMAYPGGIGYSSDLLFRFLDETCKEISRNGIKKIILVNGHGGNVDFLQFFCRIQLETPRDYVVYAITPSVNSEVQQKITEMRKTTTGGHACEMESSWMMAIRPDLVKIDRASNESGDNQNLLPLPLRDLTGVRWYSQYPNQYAGDGKDANAALGEIHLNGCTDELVKVVKVIKADKTTLQLYNDFFKNKHSPLETKAWETKVHQ